MTSPESFPCYVVRKSEKGPASGAVEFLSGDDLPPGDVLIEVQYSSLNYKDAMAAQGHAGVVNQFPHVPGIDCAGRVAASTSSDYQPGDEVLVTGYELGAPAWGGWSAYVRVPAEWVVPLPTGLSTRECMIYGTAGFTAAQAVTAIVQHGITPDHGPVLVTGATGGVGSVSVAILAKLGYEVIAVTGKPEQHKLLYELGAATILAREAVIDESHRPLLTSRWAAAVDSVGGEALTTIVRSLEHRGLVAACGLVGGDGLSLTVYPFLLRGVTLAGIDSAKCPRQPRLEMWQKLAGPWRIEKLEALADEVDFSQLAERVEALLAGRGVGRTLVRPVAAN